MQTWLELEEFSKLVHIDMQTLHQMIDKGELFAKEEDGRLFIEATKGTNAIIPKSKELLTTDQEAPKLAGADFVEKTIGTILNMHEKVLDAKDETLEALKSENRFLKEALFSMQELYDEDRKTIDSLNEQLKITQEELEFTRRKYKLMWNKAVDNYKS
jgi:hypothetical protein